MESTAPDNASVDLSYYGAMLRRRWRLSVVGLLLGVLAGFAMLYVQPMQATSTAQVNVNPIADNAFSSSRPPSDLLVPETEQAMARSTDVVTSVSELSETEVTPAQVRASMVATLLPDSTVLRIDYTAPTAKEAAAGAALVAQEYLVYRSSVAQERIELAVEQLEKRRKKLNTDLEEANQDAASSEGPAQAAAESRAQSIQSDLTSVNSQVNQLRAISTSGGTIISHPDPDRAALSPNRPLMIISGVFGGLLLALVLPFLANAFDRRVRDAHDVARAGGGAVVATLADTEALVPPGEEDADQIRALRERLMAVVTTASPVVVVADIGPRGALPGDVAANLAVLVADAGRDTTLLLANYPDEAFGELVRSLGLVEGRFVHGARHFHSRVVTSLLVVVPAPFVDRVSTADVVAGLLQEERRRGSVTVVGVAPGGGHSVRLTAARLAHQVVLNVPRVTTRTDVLSDVVGDLRAVGAQIHGTVLVDGGRVLAGDASLVPPHPLDGWVPDRFPEAREADPEQVEEPKVHQSQSGLFSPWFYREPLEAGASGAAASDAAPAVQVAEPVAEPVADVVDVPAAEPTLPEAADAPQVVVEDAADPDVETEADVETAVAEADAETEAEDTAADAEADPESPGSESDLEVDDPRVIPVEGPV